MNVKPQPTRVERPHPTVGSHIQLQTNRPEPTLSERIVAALSSEDCVVPVALRLPAHECPASTSIYSESHHSMNRATDVCVVT
ncbi:hypothetical protein F01_520038 [Burkholderia cenocepacia]|nr:hypothetical protein F01_520038 [Burkholderia cenocepacia]